jgi:hypothetical protein
MRAGGCTEASIDSLLLSPKVAGVDHSRAVAGQVTSLGRVAA